MIEHCLLLGLDALQTENMLKTQGVPRCMTRIGESQFNGLEAHVDKLSYISVDFTLSNGFKAQITAYSITWS